MLLHEKMRLRRKVNKMTLKQSRLANRKSRIADKITKIQKMYSSQETYLDKMQSIWAKNYQNMMSNVYGFGTYQSGFNFQTGGVSQFFLNKMGAMVGQEFQYGTDKDGNALKGKLPENWQQIMAAENAGAITPVYCKKGDGTEDKTRIDHYTDGNSGTISVDDYRAFKAAQSQTQQMQSQVQMWMQQQNTNYEQTLSIWIEAQKHALEQEQEEMLLPLEAEQTDIELENDGLEVQLTDARERLKNLEEACKEGIRDSAPKFGLG